MADPTPNRPPLWQVMRDAYDDAFPEYDEITDGYAAELRAIADWLEAEYQGSMGVIRAGIMVVVERLRAEADRAEAEE